MVESTRVLLRSAIDYAGTFPPAALDLEAALSVYAGALHGTHAAMLGRFVLPVSKLDEFAHLIPAFVTTEGPRWELSILVNCEDDLERIWSFRSAQTDRVAVTAMEVAPGALHEVERMAGAVFRESRGIEVYFECRVDSALEPMMGTIARTGACAKVRTGGTAPGAFPDASELVHFMRACAAAGIAFKATAGLHHALSGCYPLTYDADSSVGHMYGFLNVCACAAMIHAGASDADAMAVLRESSPLARAFTDKAIEWRGHRVSVGTLATVRQVFFRSFGSCAFDDPIDDLERLHLL